MNRSKRIGPSQRISSIVRATTPGPSASIERQGYLGG